MGRHQNEFLVLFLTSRLVSVDVKHHVYLLTYLQVYVHILLCLANKYPCGLVVTGVQRHVHNTRLPDGQGRSQKRLGRRGQPIKEGGPQTRENVENV